MVSIAPWAFYGIGMLHLLLGQPCESLAAYAKAIQFSTNDWMIDTSLRLLDRLTIVRDELPGYEWKRRLLLVGWAVKFPVSADDERVRRLASAGYGPIAGPVVIVSGGCNASREVARAVSKGVPVIPFRIEDVQPSDDMGFFMWHSSEPEPAPPTRVVSPTREP